MLATRAASFGARSVSMPRPTSFGRDTGLQARMLLTFFLLGLVYVVLIAVAIAAAKASIGIVIIAAVFALQVFASDKIALRAMGAREVSPAGGARAPRDDRAPLHPGRPAQAEGRRDADPDAQRVRDGPLAEVGDGVRDDGDHGAALPRRARGRDGPRAHPRHQPRRDDHDHGELLRLDRVDDRAVRVLLRRRRRQRRRRRPGLPRRHAGLAGRLRDLVLPDAGPVALPRVRRRPRRGGAHRPAERARLGAAEDQRHDGAHPAAATCARTPR